jgi:hypothetical protein
MYKTNKEALLVFGSEIKTQICVFYPRSLCPDLE